MRKKIVAGNWKMNKTPSEAVALVNELKPLIDKLFYTIPDDTAVGGSSMGGIMAFYAYIYRPDVFKMSLSFSPAFFFYKKNDWIHILD